MPKINEKWIQKIRLLSGLLGGLHTSVLTPNLRCKNYSIKKVNCQNETGILPQAQLGSQWNSFQKGFVSQLLLVLLLVGGIGLGTYLVQQKTNLLPKAQQSTDQFFLCEPPYGEKTECPGGETLTSKFHHCDYLDDDKKVINTSNDPTECALWRSDATSNGSSESTRNYCTQTPAQCPADCTPDEKTLCSGESDNKRNSQGELITKCQVTKNEGKFCVDTQWGFACKVAKLGVVNDGVFSATKDCATDSQGLTACGFDKTAGVYKCISPTTAAGAPSGGAKCSDDQYYCDRNTGKDLRVHKSKGVSSPSDKNATPDKDGCVYKFDPEDCALAGDKVCKSDENNLNAKCLDKSAPAPVAAVGAGGQGGTSGGTGGSSGGGTTSSGNNTLDPNAVCGYQEPEHIAIPCYKIGIFDEQTLVATKLDAAKAVARYNTYKDVLEKISGYIGDLAITVKLKNEAALKAANACIAGTSTTSTTPSTNSNLKDNGQTCTGASDCKSGICTNGVCSTSSSQTGNQVVSRVDTSSASTSSVCSQCSNKRKCGRFKDGPNGSNFYYCVDKSESSTINEKCSPECGSGQICADNKCRTFYKYE